MSEVEQTREQYMEAVNDVLDRIFKWLQKKDKELEPNEMTEKVLKFLKKNPELAKEFIQKLAKDDIIQNYQSFKKQNRESLDKINEIKRNIDTSNEKGKKIYDMLNHMEKMHIDKEKNVDKMVANLFNEKANDEKNQKPDKEKGNELKKEYELEIE